jgi:hypothetical protein
VELLQTRDESADELADAALDPLVLVVAPDAVQPVRRGA